MSGTTDPGGTGATMDDVRRMNLREVLRLVHRDGPLSRAEITRSTGMNRSTVAGLVTELVTIGLVEEGGATPTRRVGRPSPLVSATAGVGVLAVHPEVDAIEVAWVGLGGVVHRRTRFETNGPSSPAEFVRVAAALVDALTPLAGSGRVLGVGVAVPGVVDESSGVVLAAPHLGWEDVPVGEMLSAATGLRVTLANDANCGALAEATFGAGRDGGTVVYLNGGSSGVGGGITVDGALLTGHSGYAGEIGHTLVRSDGERCRCGAVGCFETEVRGDRLPVPEARADPSGSVWDRAITAALRDEGGAGAAEVSAQIGYLATAVRGVINVLNPRLVVLGGHLAALLRATGEAGLLRAVGDTLPGGVDDVRVVQTALGDENLLIGAAELAFAPVLADPASLSRVDSARAVDTTRTVAMS